MSRSKSTAEWAGKTREVYNAVFGRPRTASRNNAVTTQPHPADRETKPEESDGTEGDYFDSTDSSVSSVSSASPPQVQTQVPTQVPDSIVYTNPGASVTKSAVESDHTTKVPTQVSVTSVEASAVSPSQV